MIFYSISRSQQTAPLVEINCPACQSHAHGEPVELIETVRLFHAVRVFTQRSVYIRCLACERWLDTSLPLDQIGSIALEERNRRIYPNVSFVGKAMTIVSLLLFWFPFGTPLIAGLALLLTRRSPGWRKASLAALILSLLVLAAVIVILSMPTTRR